MDRRRIKGFAKPRTGLMLEHYRPFYSLAVTRLRAAAPVADPVFQSPAQSVAQGAELLCRRLGRELTLEHCRLRLLEGWGYPSEAAFAEAMEVWTDDRRRWVPAPALMAWLQQATPTEGEARRQAVALWVGQMAALKACDLQVELPLSADQPARLQWLGALPAPVAISRASAAALLAHVGCPVGAEALLAQGHWFMHQQAAGPGLMHLHAAPQWAGQRLKGMVATLRWEGATVLSGYNPRWAAMEARVVARLQADLQAQRQAALPEPPPAFTPAAPWVPQRPHQSWQDRANPVS
jgi:hypothetical protein